MPKKKRVFSIILIILIILALIAAVYFTFFFYYSCPNSDMACYRAHQEKCARTKFINDAQDSTWYYKITGKSNNQCVIQVTLLSVKEGTFSSEKISLEGKSMTCSLPLGSNQNPEQDLSNCHGLLKENIQEIMIKNAHSYIVGNIGQVGQALGKVI